MSSSNYSEQYDEPLDESNSLKNKRSNLKSKNSLLSDISEQRETTEFRKTVKFGDV